MKKFTLLFAILSFIFINIELNAQISGSIMHDGIERDYQLFLPSNYQDYVSLPLVFNLHGLDSNGGQQELYSGMSTVADTAKFFVCYANGFKYDGTNQAWNVGWSFGSDKDDVGFLSALIDTLSANYNIDLDAVFSCGMSNGGFMSYKLACELGDRIKAIASVTGSMFSGEVQNCSPSTSIPVMQIHGTADQVVPYNGSTLVNIPIEDLVSLWVDNNNCDLESDTIPVPDIAVDGTTSERIEYNDCDDDSRVVFYKVTNGGHSWPGAFPLPQLGLTSQDFSAANQIWLFFKPYTSPPIIVSNKELVNISQVKVNPNPFDEFINLSSQKGNLKAVKIHNTVGQLVFYQAAIQAINFQVSTTDFQKGVYFITVETTEGNTVLKTIKH